VANLCQSSGCPAGVVSVLLGNGDGTFQSPISYESGGYGASSVAIADVDGDLIPDLVVSNNCESLSGILICAPGSRPFLGR
jgi:hypothetical protein